MRYRQSDGRSSRGPTFTLGPFKGDVSRINTGVVALLLGLGLLGWGLSADSITCARTDDGGTCTVEKGPPLITATTRFDLAAVGEVRWIEYTRPKSDPLGKTVLVLNPLGNEIAVADTTREEAAAQFQVIRRFFEDESIETLNAKKSSNRASLLMGGGLCLGAMLLFASFLAALRRVTVTLEPGGRWIAITRHRWLGSSTARVYSSEVAAVGLQRGTVRRLFPKRGERLDQPAVRVVLEKRDGSAVPLNVKHHVDEDMQRDGARRLELFLGLGAETEAVVEARASEVTEQDSAEIHEPVVGDLPSSPAKKPRAVLAKRLAFYLPFIAIAVGGAVMTMVTATGQGTLVVKCTHRCRMGPVECLPGGSFQGTYDPGEYAIEVWDPERPDNWEPRRVLVKKGETTRFECVPTR